MTDTNKMVYPLADAPKKQDNIKDKRWYRVFQVIRVLYLIVACLFGLLILITSFANGDILDGTFGTVIYAVIVYVLDLGITYAVKYIAAGK